MNTFDKRTLKKITSTLESLSSSTYTSLRPPFGPQVDVLGRNGYRPRWTVRDKQPVHDNLDAYFLFDNGKHASIVSLYYVDLYLDFDTIYAPMPIHAVLPLFRGVGEVFLAHSSESVRRLFFPTSVVHVWACHPYAELLKFD